MWASKSGRTDVVELLINHNADVNARTKVRLHTRDTDMRLIRVSLNEPHWNVTALHYLITKTYCVFK